MCTQSTNAKLMPLAQNIPSHLHSQYTHSNWRKTKLHGIVGNYEQFVWIKMCVGWEIGGLYLQFMSIWTVVSNGLARGWLIALHVNRMLRSWRPSGPNVISLFTLRPPFVSYVSLIIGILSLYQWMTGIGLPVKNQENNTKRIRIIANE